MKYLHAVAFKKKHCNFNTKIDSPPSANGDTPRKNLIAACSRIIFKSMGIIFLNDRYGFRKGY